MKRLYINGSLADLPDSPIGISKQTFDLTKPGERFTDMSTGFTLPFTSRNKNLFGFVDRPGVDLTNIHGTQSVALYFDAFKVFSQGTLISKAASNGYQCYIKGGNEVVKVWEDYSVEDAIDLDSDIGTTISAVYATAVSNLAGIWNNWLLPVLTYVEGVMTTIRIYDHSTGVESNLYYNLSTLISNVISDSGISVKVLQGGSFVAWGSSTIEGIVDDYFFPAWKYRLYSASKTVQDWVVRKETSGTRYFYPSTESVDYADVLHLGGNNMFQVLKLIATLFNHGIYIDDIADEIILFPLTEIGYDEVDLTGKVIKATKNFNIKNYENNNRIRYDVKDKSLGATYNEISIDQSIGWLSNDENILFQFETFFPERKYNNHWYDNYVDEDTYQSKPCIYDLTGHIPGIHYRTVNYIFDGVTTFTTSLNLASKSMVDNPSYFTELENIIQAGIMYDAELVVNLYDLLNIKPWTSIKINELGGRFYLNKLNSFDPYNNASAKAELIKLP